MSRVLILVEGQTEEMFVGKVLAPHLRAFGVYIHPVLATTKRSKSGLKFKGGIVSYQKVRRDLLHLLGNRGAVAVTTMIDYYGLPQSFPGVDTLPRNVPYDERAIHLERALLADLGSRRLLPYLSLHEFEALLFASPVEIQAAFSDRPVMDQLSAACPASRSPEEINDGPDTHPAARLQALLPSYQKTSHGPLIAERIGLAVLRQRCPHFDGWVSRLESFGP